MAIVDIDLLNREENWERLRDFFTTNPMANFQGRLYDFTFSAAVTDFPMPHGLTFLPSASWIIDQSDSTITVTLVRELYTTTNIYITTSGAVSGTLMVGKFL